MRRIAKTFLTIFKCDLLSISLIDQPFSNWDQPEYQNLVEVRPDLVIGSPGLHQAVEEEGGGGEEEAEDPAEADSQLSVELGPQNLGADWEHHC